MHKRRSLYWNGGTYVNRLIEYIPWKMRMILSRLKHQFFVSIRHQNFTTYSADIANNNIASFTLTDQEQITTSINCKDEWSLSQPRKYATPQNTHGLQTCISPLNSHTHIINISIIFDLWFYSSEYLYAGIYTGNQAVSHMLNLFYKEIFYLSLFARLS